MAQITSERKGDSIIITVPCGKETLADGHYSGSGKTWVFGAEKVNIGGLIVQVSAYTSPAQALKSGADVRVNGESQGKAA